MTFFSLFILGLALACTISLAAWHLRMLTGWGAVAAALLGTVVYGCGGLGWAVLLVAFFAASSLLSRFRKGFKSSLNDKFSKGARRDAGQVLANGGVAGLLALLNIFFPSNPMLWLGFAGSLAAVNADTWATELGVLGKQPPRLITTWKLVEKGESGGITAWGTLASLAGALFIAVLAIIAAPFPIGEELSSRPLLFMASVALAGFAGSTLDSLLGASLQAGYFCPSCNKRTEHSPLHTCGSPTNFVGGLPWLNNDGVNALCAFCGSVAAILLWVVLG